MSMTSATVLSGTVPVRSDAAAPLSQGLILGWSFGTLGPVVLLYVVNYLLMFFLTDKLGLAAAVAGTAIFALRLFDLAFDLAVGVLSDRTRSRWGRRRPWMAVGAILMTLAVAMMFNMPANLLHGAAPKAQTVLPWIMVSLLFYFAGYSMFNVPYLAMPAEMTASPDERTRLMSRRVFFVGISGIFGITFPNWLIHRLGGDTRAFGSMALVMAALGLVSMLVCVAATASARGTLREKPKFGLKRQIGVALGNTPFVILMATKLLVLLALSTITTTMLYFVTHVLHRTIAVMSLYGLLTTAGIVFSIPLWARVAKRMPKHVLFAIATGASIPISLSWVLATPSEPQWAFVLRVLLQGIAAGGSLLMGQSMLPDTIEYDYRRCGLRREGIFSAVYSFMEKASFAFGPLIVGLLLAGFGYSTHMNAQQATHANAGILAGVAWLPALSATISVVLLLFYRLPGPDDPVAVAT